MIVRNYDEMDYEKLLQDYNVLITGAGAGIGRETALLFAHHGARVAIADIDAAAGKAVEAELQKISPESFFVQADMGDLAQVDAMCDEVLKRMGGKMHSLVNNAGIFEGGRIMDADIDGLSRMFDVNVKGLIRCTQRILPAMVEAQGGTVVNMASDYAIRGCPGVSMYAATKGAIYSFTRAIAIELGRYDIRANCILPGMNIASFGDRHIEKVGQAQADIDFSYLQPIRHRGSEEDVADAALYLASQLSRFLTGEAIEVNGGITARAHKQTMQPDRKGW